ncbi:hypothetical protein [Methylobacterium sp. J-090]|uniref:hypothetical protein n=1 Tax=Methylobacterium sp. J-090 TaxID=2836666 RepID=UPI001FBA31FE|nr:hypothetical protein [Methylobacterium sp. J-090]MCJ2080714.1 hypothetical protein [Methylobacterium sp. J-090]
MSSLLDLREHFTRQMAALEEAERRVRRLALREASQILGDVLDDPPEHGTLRRNGELQEEANQAFREMQATHAAILAQITTLLAGSEALYEATFL